MKTGTHFALLLILLLAAWPAEAGCKPTRGIARSWPGVYAVRAQACDPVSRRCVSAIRRFSNPVWR